MAEELTLFKCISTATERQALFQTLLKDNGNLYLKDKFERSLPLKAVSVDSRFFLKCTPPSYSEIHLPENETFLAVFFVDQEKYLFETRPEFQDGHIILPVMNLFHMQRRKTFRYQIPSRFPALLKFTHLNKISHLAQAHLTDLSIQGCAAEMPLTDEFKLEDIVEAEILLGDRSTIKVQGVVKNLRQGSEHLVVGLEFHHLVHSSEEPILEAITELQRETFSRKPA